MNDLVSIIIPTYNTNNSLKRAVQSVLNQTYTNIEIIVVDDNKKESEGRKNAQKIMKCFSEYENVIYIMHEENKNGSAARNTGFKQSKGKYIGFLDDDDYFFAEKIEKQLEFLKKTKLNFCTCFYKKNGMIKKFEEKNNYIEDILFLKITPQTSSFLMKRSLYEKLDGFDESYYRHQDYEFLIRVCLDEKVGVLKEVLYERLDNGVDNIPNAERMEKIKDKLLSEFDFVFEKYNINKKKVYAKNYSYVFIAYIKNKNLSGALRILKKYKSLYFILFCFNRIFYMIKNKIKKYLKRNAK